MLRGWWIAADLGGVLDERRGELCQGELERKRTIMTGTFIALDQATDLGAPFGRQVANGEIEGLRFSVRARGLTLSYHKILKPTNV